MNKNLLAGLVDTDHGSSNAIFKIVTGKKVSITQGGDVSYRLGANIFRGIGNMLTGGWNTSLSTSNFSELYKVPIGKNTYPNLAPYYKDWHPYR